jgi:hypothetical protein
MVFEPKTHAKNKFTPSYTMDCVHRYPYLIPNGIMNSQNLFFWRKSGFLREKRLLIQFH